MTTRELSQLYYLTQEIKRARERLAELRTAAASAAAHITGMPRSNSASDRTAASAIRQADLEDTLDRKIELLETERIKLLTYINSIPDSLTRQIFQLRFEELLTYTQIVWRLGGGNTEWGIKKRIQRELARRNTEESA
ncbi:MAG: hypothetical protein LBQ91_06240 [Oscillospiraceae bacterium]|jgi:DNA-directed RNA polymerase specialized sigma subunit|nr:hypothetical protein [Oscillospiraceae bacterium]